MIGPPGSGKTKLAERLPGCCPAPPRRGPHGDARPLGRRRRAPRRRARRARALPGAAPPGFHRVARRRRQLVAAADDEVSLATPSVMQCPQGSLSAVSFQGIAGCRLPVWGDPAVSGVGGIGDMRRGRNVQSALPCSADALQKLTHASSDIVSAFLRSFSNVSTTRPPRRGRRQRRWSRPFSMRA